MCAQLAAIAVRMADTELVKDIGVRDRDISNNNVSKKQAFEHRGMY